MLERRVRAAEDALLGALDEGERQALRLMLRRVACAVRDIEPGIDPCDAAGHPRPGPATKASEASRS
jgi:hypothetical protein